MLLCPVFIFGQTWDYPVKPGTEEWKKLKTGKEKNEACQIPENVLKKISSHELAYLLYNKFFTHIYLSDFEVFPVFSVFSSIFFSKYPLRLFG